MGPRELTAVKVIKKGDYLYVKVPGHPHATKRGYVLQHRFVKEQKLGRFLRHDEVVHHEDENKKNNAPKNLKVKSVSRHMRDHHQKKRIVVSCAQCGKSIERVPSQLPKRRGLKHSFCSYSCNGSFNGRGRIKGSGRKVHGTNNCYTNYACRCGKCKEAHRIEAIRQRKTSS